MLDSVKFGALALVAGLAMNAGVAEAVTFDFTPAALGVSGNTGSTTLDVTVGDVSVAIASTGGNINVNVNGRGLGVQGAPEAGAVGLGEALTFDLSTVGDPIRGISTVLFEAGPEDEFFNLYDGDLLTGVLIGTFSITGANNGGGGFEAFEIGSLISGTIFTLEGLAANDPNSNLGFRVAQLSATVPLPASLLLMLGGVGGLAGLRIARRRRPA